MIYLPGPVPTPLPPPVDPVSIVLDIVTFILRIFGLGSPDISGLVRSINTTWTNLVFTSTFLFNALRSFWDFMRKLVGIIIDGLKHIISDILHGHLLQALLDIQKLFHDLHTLFKPILDFIDKLRAWYYKYIYKWIKLVENILSTVRAVLAVFRILGAKWAAKLDADIQRIQGWIAKVNQDIVGSLNQVSTWLNFALDPVGILRPHFLNNSLLSALGPVKRIVAYGANAPLSASQIQSQADDKALYTSPTGILTNNADGTVTLSDDSKGMEAAANAAVDYYGRAPAPH